jgi:hypothetical protein
MKNIIKTVGVLALCVCVGTVLAQMLIAAVVLPRLKIDRQRIAQIVAIAQGADLAAKEDAKAAATPEGEQASYQEIVESRAVKYRNLELREQQLRNDLVQVQTEEGKLADEAKTYKQIRDSFNAQLKDVRETSTAAGMDDVLRTLISIKPEQAKEVLLDMLDKKEIDAVVVFMKQMPDKKRANIIGEFTSEEEKQKLSEVLRRLREGLPEIKAVDKAQAKLEAKSPS